MSAGPAVPAVLIAGTASGAGKTTVAAGIMAALHRRSLRVQPFKVGPDYIDPTYHNLACGRQSRNLDSWMVPPPVLGELYARAAASADIVIVEGVMGLFDGRSGRDDSGSSAEVARLLGLPVLLVVDVSKTARSAAAVVTGFLRFDPRVRIVGVIANNVGSPNHLRMVREAIESRAGVPVVGHLPRRAELRIPERHLGLIPAVEGVVGGDFFDRLADQVEKTVDLEGVLCLARQAQSIHASSSIFPEPHKKPRATIAIARDEAFCFYYQDNLDLLAAWGAELVSFSPLHDRTIPGSARGLYLGGGFPELFAAALAANLPMLASIQEAHADGMPMYAECGGLMYLCQNLVDVEGNHHRLGGLVPNRAVMQGRRSVLGYTEVRARETSVLMRKGQTARGHEFHWSVLGDIPDERDAAYDVLEDGRHEGYLQGNLLASYIHLHFGSNPALAANFVGSCARWRKKP